MRFIDILTVSLYNTGRAKTRAFLTAVSICVGVSSVMLISSLGDSGGALISKEIDKMGVTGITVFSTKSNTTLTEDHISAIKKTVSLARDVQPLIIETGSFRIKNTGGNTVIWGVDNNVENVVALDLLHGRLPNSVDVSQKERVAVVDSELANSMYKRTNIVGKEIILTVSNHSERFKIIGVVSSQKDGLNQLVGGIIPQFIYVPYKTLGALRGDEGISQIAINCENPEDNDRAGELTVSALSRITGHKNSFGFENINTHATRFKDISSIVTLLVSAIAAISLIVAGIGIMNTMLAATGERKKEIGIMMAIGARRRDIALCFMTESAIISGIGGIVGAVFGVVLSVIITTAINMPTVISITKLLFVVIISVICGILFALIPSYRASCLTPVETLHQ